MKPIPAGTLFAFAALLSSCPVILAGTVRRGCWKLGQTVETSSGPVEGQQASGGNGVSEYLGIPYALPPVGKRRWLPPARFSGNATIKATSFGPGCIELKGPGVGEGGGNSATKTLTEAGKYIIGVFLNAIPETSEDCLTLNVWTKPQVGEGKKAVLVFLHGGSFTSGSSRIPIYNGQHIAGQQDVVLVTFNYRLNIWGFPGAPGQTQNLGILDQRLALEWIRDNVAGFGGDPDRIAVFGQSAGAGSADVLSYAFADDPIASGFVLESGTAPPSAASQQTTAESLWYNTSTALGCGGALSGSETVFACMQGKSRDEIAKALLPAAPDVLSPGFAPVVDEEVVFSDYTLRKPADRPVLVGNNDKEVDLFRYTLGRDLPDAFYDQAELAVYDCPAARRADVGRGAGVPTWRYRWMGVFPNTVLSYAPMTGAWHGSELPSIFGTMPETILPNTPEQNEISAYIQGAWAAFAKDPVNGLTNYGGGWPQYDPGEKTLVRIGFNNQTGTNLVDGNEYDTACILL